MRMFLIKMQIYDSPEIIGSKRISHNHNFLTGWNWVERVPLWGTSFPVWHRLPEAHSALYVAFFAPCKPLVLTENQSLNASASSEVAVCGRNDTWCHCRQLCAFFPHHVEYIYFLFLSCRAHAIDKECWD